MISRRWERGWRGWPVWLRAAPRAAPHPPPPRITPHTAPDMRLLLSLLLCLASSATRVWGLSCLPCREVTCHLPTPIPYCSWGLVLDMCGCCYVCGKGPGETCGGQWAWHGRCGRGLECLPPKESDHVREESAVGGKALALLDLARPHRCRFTHNSVADKLASFFSWLSSLFQAERRH